MQFDATPLPGAWLVRPEHHTDDRGAFARTYCQQAFAAQGLNTVWPQCNRSTNHRAGTLRGMHWQADPYGEVKLVRVTRGRCWDVALDLRPDSPTYRQHFGVELCAADALSFYLPAGMAHGFLTLEDDTEIFYMMGAAYVPGAGRGVRYNDPAFGIAWPAPVQVISARDAGYPDFEG